MSFKKLSQNSSALQNTGYSTWNAIETQALYTFSKGRYSTALISVPVCFTADDCIISLLLYIHIYMHSCKHNEYSSFTPFLLIILLIILLIVHRTYSSTLLTEMIL